MRNIHRFVTIAFAAFAISSNAHASDLTPFQLVEPTKPPENEILLELKGQFKQSGAIIGKTIPFSQIEYMEAKFNANAEGDFIIGFDRDEKSPAIIKITTPDGRVLEKTFEIKTRNYKVTEVYGLPANKVTPPKSVEKRIADEKIIKNAAWASLDEISRGFLEVFRYPLANVRTTSSWGAVRSLNGTKGQPHYGVDYGAKVGTPVFAPAEGKIVIAKLGFYIEGGLVGIDHGQGLISYYMHLSKVSVAKGKRVKKGQKIGEVGATGRANGPHLHWSLRWHNRQLDPQLMTKPMPNIDLNPVEPEVQSEKAPEPILESPK